MARTFWMPIRRLAGREEPAGDRRGLLRRRSTRSDRRGDGGRLGHVAGADAGRGRTKANIDVPPAFLARVPRPKAGRSLGQPDCRSLQRRSGACNGGLGFRRGARVRQRSGLEGRQRVPSGGKAQALRVSKWPSTPAISQTTPRAKLRLPLYPSVTPKVSRKVSPKVSPNPGRLKRYHRMMRRKLLQIKRLVEWAMRDSNPRHPRCKRAL